MSVANELKRFVCFFGLIVVLLARLEQFLKKKAVYWEQTCDHVMVNKAAYGLRIPFSNRVFALQENPQPGEVVVFDSPDTDIRLIKRVVAVGGDLVSVKNGRVLINGRFLATADNPKIEIYGSRQALLNLKDGGGPDLPAMLVPEDHVLVLGDHRGNSRDRRFFGTVPVSQIYGRATAVFLRQSEGLLWQAL